MKLVYVNPAIRHYPSLEDVNKYAAIPKSSREQNQQLTAIIRREQARLQWSREQLKDFAFYHFCRWSFVDLVEEEKIKFVELLAQTPIGATFPHYEPRSNARKAKEKKPKGKQTQLFECTDPSETPWMQ